jgi:hypothetical protein
VKLAVAALTILIGGCEIGPQEIAEQCEVLQAELDAGFNAVDRLPIGQSREVGRCTLKKVAGSQRVVVLITKDRGLFMSGGE